MRTGSADFVASAALRDLEVQISWQAQVMTLTIISATNMRNDDDDEHQDDDDDDDDDDDGDGGDKSSRR